MPARKGAQVIADNNSQIMPLIATYSGFSWLHVASGASLDLNKTQHILVPPDQINLAAVPRRPIIARGT